MKGQDIAKRLIKALEEEFVKNIASRCTCGLEENDPGDKRLWDYVKGIMSEEEDDKMCEQIKDCLYCLNKSIIFANQEIKTLDKEIRRAEKCYLNKNQ